MKRYYLSKIFLDTTPPFTNGLWRHRLQTYPNVDYEGGEIAVDPQTGIPTQKALLVLVGGIDHKQFQDDPDLVPMPDVGADVKVSAIHTATKLDAKAAVVDLGFDQAAVDQVWGNADGLRDVLNHYGKLNNPYFDCNAFDIDES